MFRLVRFRGSSFPKGCKEAPPGFSRRQVADIYSASFWATWLDNEEIPREIYPEMREQAIRADGRWHDATCSPPPSAWCATPSPAPASPLRLRC